MALAYTNAKSILSSTSRTDLYTSPSSTSSVVYLLNVANVNGTSSASITVEVYDSATTSYVKLGYLIPVPGGSSYFFDKNINLKAGDKISLTATTANYLEAFASIIQFT